MTVAMTITDNKLLAGNCLTCDWAGQPRGDVSKGTMVPCEWQGHDMYVDEVTDCPCWTKFSRLNDETKDGFELRQKKIGLESKTSMPTLIIAVAALAASLTSLALVLSG